MLNEISPVIFDNQYYQDHQIEDDDFLLCYSGNQVLLKKTGDNYEVPGKRDFPYRTETPVYLFSIHSHHCFGFIDSNENHHSFDFFDVYNLLNFPDKEIAWLVSVGHQLMTWHITNQYCGRCGAKTELKKDERARICPICNLTIFPKISPAIIVAITCNDRILLIKGKNYKSKLFTLVAGYVEIGESIEETVKREVKEEVGLDIQNLKYYKSQPWPFSGSLMLGFIAEADDNQPLVIQEDEIEEAGWFDRDQLPPFRKSVSISGEMLEAFQKGLF